MMASRFYAPEATRPDLRVSLPREEAHQLRRVLRLGPGALVQLFDGRGHEFTGRVEQIDREAVTVRTLDELKPASEPRVQLTLAVALLKGRALDEVIRDATMLGAAVICPMTTARTHVTSPTSDRVRRRWHAIAVSSAKQCRRAVVPEVREVTRFEDVVTNARSEARLLLVEPTHEAAHDSIAGLGGRQPPRSATLAVGPEGGWTDDEVRTAAGKQFVPLTLGTRTLRANAAPTAAIAVLQYIWGDL